MWSSSVLEQTLVPGPRRAARRSADRRDPVGRRPSSRRTADERRARRAARGQRGVDPVAHRDPRAAPGAAGRAAERLRRPGRARGARRAGVDASELDLVLVATLSQDELTPNTAPLVAHALGAERAGAIDVGAACTAFLSGLALGAAPDRERARGARAARSAPTSSPGSPTTTTGTAPLFADGAGAVVLGAAAASAARSARSCSAPTARTPRRSCAHSRPQGLSDGRARGVPPRGRPDGEVTLAGGRARRPDARRDRPVRLPPGQRADHARARRAARARPASASSTASRRSATRRRRRCRWRSPRPSGTGGCGPARACCWARSAPASPGAAA